MCISKDWVNHNKSKVCCSAQFHVSVTQKPLTRLISNDAIHHGLVRELRALTQTKLRTDHEVDYICGLDSKFSANVRSDALL